jgi:Na+/proline symporter
MGISLLLIYEGYKAMKQVVTVDDYFLMGGTLKKSPFIWTAIASNLSLGNFIFIAGIWGYLYGIWGIIWMIISVYAFVPLYKRFTPKFEEYITDRTNAGSIHEYISQKYTFNDNGDNALKIRLVASLSTIVCLLLALAIEINLASSFLSVFLNIDLIYVFSILTFLICLYTAIGGFRAVVTTDTLQAYALIGSLIVMIVLCASYYFQNETQFISPEKAFGTSFFSFDAIFLKPRISNILSFLVMNSCWFIVTMDTFQRNCASRNIETSMKGMLRAITYIGVAIAIYAFIGFYIKVAQIPSPSLGNNPFVDYISFFSNSGVYEWWYNVGIAIVIIGFVMAGISTADTFLLVSGHSFVTDLIIGVNKKANFDSLNEGEKEEYTNYGRAVIIGMTVLILVVWGICYHLRFLENPLSIFYVAYSPQFALLPAIWYSVTNKKNVNSAFWSIASGIATSLFYGFYFSYKMVYSPFSYTVYGEINVNQNDFVALTPIITILVSFIVYHLNRKNSK